MWGCALKIAVLALGSRGDVQPSLALGKALKARGHDVILGAPDNFADWVEGHGLAFCPLGIDMQAFLQRPEVREAIAGRWFALAKIWRRSVLQLMRNSLEATWQAARDADVIVYHPKVGGALDVAEKTGAALVSAVPIPAFPTAAFPLIVFSGNYGPWLNRLTYKLLYLPRLPYLRILNRWRAEVLGLDKGPVLLPVGGYVRNGKRQLAPRLCAISPTILPRPDDWDADTHMTGYWFLDGGPEAEPEWQPDPALAAFLEAGPPPVYIGFGSMTTPDPAGLAQTVAEGVRMAGVRAVLATGWGGLDQVDSLDAIHVINEAPHQQLFRHVAAVVHHGGAGTTAAGLRAGRPTLICPVGFDQPFWGRRVHALGCGPEPHPLKRLAPEPFARALRDLTTNVPYQKNAAAIAQSIAAEDGLAQAVTVIEAAGQH